VPKLDQTIDVHGAEKKGRAPVAARLVVVSGPDAGAEVALDAVVEVGADPACKLVLHDPAVSRRHLSVSALGGRIVVKDLGSRNGTFVGGTRIREAEVPLGAVLAIGDSSIAIQSRWYVREVTPSAERSFGELIGQSIAMREIFSVLERVAPSDVTLLVEGESGTGKELAARSVHAASGRAAGPYVVFDCASVPGELAESELFGHKKGAFSGATGDRQGAFQRAHGGTLFLDELGELPLDLQPKLLRALEVGEVRAVGDDVPRKVDVRVVAATNRDLHAEAQRGRFRSALLYRLEVVKVRLPPLRARLDDVPLLVAKLLEGKLAPGDAIAGDNLTRLMNYAWPGNVRELRNTLSRALTLASAPGQPPPPFAKLVFNLGPASERPATLGMEFPGVSQPMPFKEAKAQLLAAFERAYVSALLERHDGNILQAAASAGLSRKYLYDLLNRLDGLETGVAPPDED
jgi:DNA-binding NtrC family response regulator